MVKKVCVSLESIHTTVAPVAPLTREVVPTTALVFTMAAWEMTKSALKKICLENNGCVARKTPKHHPPPSRS